MSKTPTRHGGRGGQRDQWTLPAELQRAGLVTLLDLAQVDLDALSASQRQPLRAAVRRVVGEIGMLVDATGESNVVTDVPSLSFEDLRPLQTSLRDGLELLYPLGAWRPPLQWAPPLAVDAIEIGRGSNEFGLIYVVRWPDAFWFATLKLLERHGTDVGRCARCGRLYLRTKRQEFCTTVCAQRARSKRWYETHRDEVLERRHQAYRAAHPKRKIRRRKRAKRRR